MSTDQKQQPSDAPLANDYEAQAEKLRDAVALIDEVASVNPVVEPYLRDAESGLKDTAAVIEVDGNEITVGEFAERVYTSAGGRQ